MGTDYAPKVFRRRWQDPATGRWKQSAYFFLYWRDAAGKQHSVRTSPPVKDRSAAERQLFKLVNATGGHSATTVADLLLAYEKYLEVESPTTAYTNGSRLRTMRERWGRKRATHLTLADVDAFALELKAKGKSDSTIGGHLTLLKAAFNRARTLRVLGEHELCRAPVTYKAAQRHVFWTEEEIAKLRAHLPVWAWQAVQLLVFTGLRVGDALRLRWENIEGDVLRIQQQKARRRKDAGQLETVLSREAQALLAEIPRTEHPWLFPANPHREKDGTLVVNPKAKRNFTRLFIEARREAGCEGKTIHDLRRTFSQRLKLAGWDDRTIAALMGQKTTTMVPRYTKLELDLLRRAVNREAATPPASPEEGKAAEAPKRAPRSVPKRKAAPRRAAGPKPRV